MERYIDKFIRYLQIEKDASLHTIKTYRADLLAFKDFLKGVQDPNKVNYLLLRKFLAHLKDVQYDRKTIARKLACLRSFFKFLCRDGYLRENPAAGLSTPKLQKKLPLFLDVDKTIKVLQAPNDKDLAGLRDRAILETLYSTGMRVSELVGMDVRSVDFIGGVAKVKGKGKKEKR